MELERVRAEDIDDADWPAAVTRWQAAECLLDFGSLDGSVTVTQDRIHDLRQADRIENVDFSSARFGDGDANFNRATLGKVYVGGAMPGDGDVFISDATFGDRGVYFGGATFGDSVSFSGATFGEGAVYFNSATFGGGADFRGARFGNGGVDFRGAKFAGGNVRFSDATFGDSGVSFSGATFAEGNVLFNRATFGDDDVTFGEATFAGAGVYFSGATFGGGDVYFGDATFGDGDVSFQGATFGTRLGTGSLSFAGANFGDVRFTLDHCRFEWTHDDPLTPDISLVDVTLGRCRLVCRAPVGLGSIVLNNSTWNRCEIDLVPNNSEPQATELTMDNSRVEGDLRLALGNVQLHAERLTVRGQGEIRSSAAAETGPRLASLREADISSVLRIGRRVDVKATRWGDQDLTRIEMAATDTLERQRGRRILAGDHRSDSTSTPATIGEAPAPVSDEVLERNYRDLRMRLERIGATHSANDFYYGEMDARRRHTTRKAMERWLLEGYRWVSGYGTRAWSAIVAWFAVTFVFAALIVWFGTSEAPQTLGDALVLSASTSLSFFRPSDTSGLPTWLQGVGLLVRVAGPVLFGLAALATRNRVKR